MWKDLLISNLAYQIRSRVGDRELSLDLVAQTAHIFLLLRDKQVVGLSRRRGQAGVV